MTTVAETFARAWKHHQENDLQKAKQLYHQILQADPSHADSWCYYGAACQAEGRLTEAETAFRRAIQLVPTYASAMNFLGVLMAQQGRLDEAGATFQRLLLSQPGDADALNNLGLVRFQQGRLQEAINCYEHAIGLRPNFLAAQTNLGAARQQHATPNPTPPAKPPAPPGNATEAAKAAVNRGVALAKQGRMEDAKFEFEQAIQWQADNVDAHNNLGSVLVQQQRYAEAVASLKRVLALQPEHVEGRYNLAIVLHKQGQVEEAIACYQQAARIRPSHLDAQNNLGNIYKEQGRLDEALAGYEQALRWHPHHAGTHFNRALIWLSQGKWSEGWPEYEWRWQTDEFPRYTFQQPRWDGLALSGRSILVYAEQGLGDTLQFVRLLPQVRQRGGRVVFQCQNPLSRLLASAKGIDVLLPRGQTSPDIDVHIPLLSLPGVFGISPGNAPAAVPYLAADDKLVADWKRELAPLGGFKIGIAWQGSPTYRDDRRRSIPLECFAPLTSWPGVQVISLQKGPGTEQIPTASARLSPHVPGKPIDEANGAFMDTAAIMKNLDLVVCSDSAVAHLAGALAVPVWVALPVAPDWRWLMDREDSPWYPTMRLFRQTQVGKWDDVFDRIVEGVKLLVGSRQ